MKTIQAGSSLPAWMVFSLCQQNQPTSMYPERELITVMSSSTFLISYDPARSVLFSCSVFPVFFLVRCNVLPSFSVLLSGFPSWQRRYLFPDVFSFLNTVADNKRITIKTMTDKNNLLFLNFFTLPRQLPYFPLLNRFNMIGLSRLWIIDQEIKELTCDYSIGRSAKWQIVRFHNIAGVCS